MSAHFASIISKKIQKYYKKFTKKYGQFALPMNCLRVQTWPMAGNPAIFRSDVHQNDIRPDFTDAMPRNAVVIPLTQYTQIFARAGD